MPGWHSSLARKGPRVRENNARNCELVRLADVTRPWPVSLPVPTSAPYYRMIAVLPYDSRISAAWDSYAGKIET